MIEISGLTKRYGDVVVVDGLSFEVRPGRVTGFLGPNGAGKSTTMRILLGLARASSGSATIDGQLYSELREPLRQVGALLEATPVQRGRTAYRHLLALAQTHGIAASRVEEVLDLVGLTSVAGRSSAEFSLGMRQRLGVAAVLLGEPSTLVLDEPANGLDPAGVHWLRNLLRDQAAEGRTVFVSSHLISEMALTADQLVVVGRGRLLADLPIAELTSGHASLEEAYLQLTGDSVEFSGGAR
ncbi:ATP-binding cassette domain-containing protein [Kribbella qitaiheensis]|uniref:ATP-binding cassette domain-containing protein n=1 Tax=Kribbella qitaiheensis TaxID=1544730 RepID=A0A7G6WSU6_9ACTN|nr:ATP-binding cassette domain-containing protein [Kribbella qitaiheensis]QNE17061.1 ATP-binding cassette domain-containing protein [Kribbella qitaiheensis]